MTDEISREIQEQGGQLSKRKIMNLTKIGSFPGTLSNGSLAGKYYGVTRKQGLHNGQPQECT